MKFAALFLFVISQVFAVSNYGDKENKGKEEETCPIKKPTTASQGQTSNGELFWCSDYHKEPGDKYTFLWFVKNNSTSVQNYVWAGPNEDLKRQVYAEVFNKKLSPGKHDHAGLTLGGPPERKASVLNYGRGKDTALTEYWFGRENEHSGSLNAQFRFWISSDAGDSVQELEVDSSAWKHDKGTDLTLALTNTSQSYPSSIDLDYHGKNLIEALGKLVEQKKMDSFKVKEESIDQQGSAMELANSPFRLASLQHQQQPQNGSSSPDIVDTKTNPRVRMEIIKKVINMLRSLRPGRRLTISAKLKKGAAMEPLQVSFLEHKKAVAGATMPAFLPQ